MEDNFFERHGMHRAQAAQDDMRHEILIENLRKVVTEQGILLRQQARKLNGLEAMLERHTQRLMELEKSHA